MISRNVVFILSFTISVFVLGLCGCGHVRAADGTIRLKEFSEENYEILDSNIGRQVCISGIISIDSIGVYFSLQPITTDEFIDVGFSRINSGLSYEDAARENMKDGEVYEICGVLHDVTPFQTCNTDYCKWYELQSSTVGRVS